MSHRFQVSWRRFQTVALVVLSLLFVVQQVWAAAAGTYNCPCSIEANGVTYSTSTVCPTGRSCVCRPVRNANGDIDGAFASCGGPTTADPREPNLLPTP